MREHYDILEYIEKEVSKELCLDVSVIFEKSRRYDCVQARQALFYVIRNITFIPYRVLTQRYKMNHATIINAIYRCMEEMESNPWFRKRVNNIMTECEKHIKECTKE